MGKIKAFAEYLSPTHQSYGHSYFINSEAIRAELGRRQAEALRLEEARNPTPDSTAKRVRSIFDRHSRSLPEYDSEVVHQALVDALEPIFTTIWSGGFDDGYEQMRSEILGALGDD